MRLQKRIAEAGIASRRKAEELIAIGKVKVNGVVITQMGYQVTDNDQIEVDGVTLTTTERKIYLALNKPSSIITSTSDEKGRRTVIDLLPAEYKRYRLYPVGRLDYDTKGIILLTNDGEFMNEMVGPTSGIEKEYLVRIKGLVTNDDLYPFYKGFTLNGVKLLPAKFSIISLDKEHESTLVKLIITEGHNHQVKNMFEAIGHPVKKLSRIRFGNITTENLPEGYVRPLSFHEIKQLLLLAKQDKNIRKRG